MVKVVTGNDFTAEVRVQTKGRPMGFVVDNVELDYVFSLLLRFSLQVSFHQCFITVHSSITDVI